MSGAATHDRFTEATRRAIALAKQSVLDYRHTHITPEHILLGLLACESPTVLVALRASKATPEQIRALLLHHLRPGAEGIPEDLVTFSERGKRVVEAAKEESVRVKALQVGPEHLLLGLTKVTHTVCGAVLRAVGISTESVRAAVSAPQE